MGWIVIDNNEAKRLPASPESVQWADFEGITVSPFVLAELFNHPPNRKYIANLAQYPVRLGMLHEQVMHHVASLRRSQIVTFRPFLNRTSQHVQQMLLHPPEQELQEYLAVATRRIKDSGDIFKTGRLGFQNALKSRGYDNRDFKFNGFAEALQILVTGHNNVLESWLTTLASINGTRSVRTSPRALYTSAMQNPYLRCYLHTLLWYYLSFQQLWTKAYDEWNIPIHKNDLTDMTLSLYAAPGDIVLSADSDVSKAVSAVNPDGAVRTARATDL